MLIYKEITIKKLCKYHGKTEYSKRSDAGYRCKKCAVASVTRRRQKLKLMSIEYLGGECQICRYNKCVASLDFHHRDPSTKDFKISTGNIKSWDRLKVELDKCALVCSNCHREIHYGMTSI